MSVDSATTTISYDDAIVRRFSIASIVFAIVGMLVGVVIAIQMAWFQANFDTPWLTFGRLRPLHTNAVIFAFVGNMIFAGIYYSMQRLLKTRMASDLLSKIHFWGWQLIIVAAAISLPLGWTQGKEYAELEWPIDLAVTVIWVVFAVNFFWTIAKRRERHLYVAIWFYIATVVTVAVLYIVNNLALPIMSGVKSYSVYAGVQDALVQWWYGHNAVAFFLTTPVLGIMYYFLPKAADRPVYSYRLSIVHFWAIVFLYIWAGPHHLLYTALPDWAQSLGMVFSLMLWAPSWGGMLNGLLTLRGAWEKLRTDPVIKFFIAGITFYGMATFEGPLLSIKSVSALSHYTDWIIGHVHVGALGWNGFMAAGLLYWLVPKLWGTQLYSKKAADYHFWIGSLGILLYAVSMWVAGISEGLMWRAVTDEGTPVYASFVETILKVRTMYLMRIVGGLLYLVGFLMLAWNLVRTMLAGKATDVTVEVVEPEWRSQPAGSWREIAFGGPIVVSAIGTLVMCALFIADFKLSMVLLVVLGVLFAVAYGMFGRRYGHLENENFHRALEGRPFVFTVLVLVAILVGGLAELVPTLTIDRAVPKTGLVAEPYSALELHGRDIYVREGCYLCHSQMIRPLLGDVVRYGPASTAGESRYDHPFQWGSKRTGPDLARVGGKWPDLWHYEHFMDPRKMATGSIMPAYKWLATDRVDVGDTVLKLSAMKTLGVPYSKDDIANGAAALEQQARGITEGLAGQGVQLEWDSEMVALIAYLQRLGKNKPAPTPAPPADAPPAEVK